MERNQMQVRGEVRTALVLSWGALLGFFARSIIDFRYVYAEELPGRDATAVVIVVYSAILGGWAAALLSLAAGRRRGAIACLAFAILAILFGVSTAVTLCPTPCATAAPLADITNWLCLALGLLSAWTLVARLRRGGLR